jgi:maltose O-acetyltransferase
MVRTPVYVEKVLHVRREETAGIHPRLIALYFAGRFVPRRTGHAMRASLLRLAGFPIGDGTLIRGLPFLKGSEKGNPDGAMRSLYHNLIIGRRVEVHPGCVFDLEERITIGDNVVIGPQAMLLTSSHELGPREHRAGPIVRNPVIIGAGAWIGARAVIFPGITIGAGAVVNPGAVVNKDVAPHTRVGGSPARPIEALDPPPT